LLAITCFLLLFCSFFTLNIDFKFAQGGNKEAKALSVNERIAAVSKQLTWPFEVKMVRF
jgi:predicted ATPase